MISKIVPNIPKIVPKVSELPEGMTQKDLENALYPNLLALARIFARHEIKERERRSAV